MITLFLSLSEWFRPVSRFCCCRVFRPFRKEPLHTATVVIAVRLLKPLRHYVPLTIDHIALTTDH